MLIQVQNRPQSQNFGMIASTKVKRMLVSATRQEEKSPDFNKIDPKNTIRAKAKRLLQRWAAKPHTEDLKIDFEPHPFSESKKTFTLSSINPHQYLKTHLEDCTHIVSNLSIAKSRNIRVLPRNFEKGQELLATKYLLGLKLGDLSKQILKAAKNLKDFNKIECHSPIK